MPFQMQPVLKAIFDLKHVFLARVSKNIGQITNFHKNGRRNVQDGSNERYWRIEYKSGDEKSVSLSPRVSDTCFWTKKLNFDVP